MVTGSSAFATWLLVTAKCLQGSLQGVMRFDAQERLGRGLRRLHGVQLRECAAIPFSVQHTEARSFQHMEKCPLVRLTFNSNSAKPSSVAIEAPSSRCRLLSPMGEGEAKAPPHTRSGLPHWSTPGAASTYQAGAAWGRFWGLLFHRRPELAQKGATTTVAHENRPWLTRERCPLRCDEHNLKAGTFLLYWM